MNHELKDVLRMFYDSHQKPLKKYENWKEGLDAVFRLSRAVILTTRKGGDVLITSSQGIGGYGRVARGYHMQLNWEKVVIKEYIGFEQQNNRLQFYGELKTLTDLCSAKDGDPLPREFIAHYIDRKEENGSYFLMSAWAGNDTSKLDTYQKNHLIGHIGSSLVIILRAIHGKGFLHRDVKPENICVDEIDTIRLIDVGSMVSVDDSGHVVTNQQYNDYQHCSLNMHKAYGKQRRCVLSIFDDLWMVIFSLLRILNMVPRYWSDQRRREDIISDKKRIISDPDVSFKGSGNTLKIMKRSICYVRDTNPRTFDYDHLARILSQL
jgi:serine/threonine protein kinase